MSVRREPRTPQLRFAPEGKCSPELPADLEPALGRGSSRSHPSLAHNPSLTERSAETDPRCGSAVDGEPGSTSQPRPFPPTTPSPSIPLPCIGSHMKFVPSPELCPWVLGLGSAQDAGHHPPQPLALPPKPPRWRLFHPWGTVKLSSSWDWGGREEG